jgi:2-oxoglutarate/2-oxoacid ferredoxin oxidoreductase subunit beta
MSEPISSNIPALRNVPKAVAPQKAADFKSDQEVRWCPGCGDYAILAAMQNFLPELGVRRENLVFVSGIGCAARFPYYLNTFGLHSIHGRAPAIATGLAVTRPDLSVWVITGDGDALSIGGNHLIHTLRRNVNVKILLFNNRIYGLTKGQYSPTSELGKITKSTPQGSLDAPFNPISLALGAGASFVARSIDSDRKHLTGILRAAAAYEGSAFVEIFQNCNIFNDGAFDLIKDPTSRDSQLLRLEHGEPLVTVDRTRGVTQSSDIPELSVVDNPDLRTVIHHDAHRADSSYAFTLSRLDSEITPIGIFRAVQQPTYDQLMSEQIIAAQSSLSEKQTPEEELNQLLHNAETWTVIS